MITNDQPWNTRLKYITKQQMEERTWKISAGMNIEFLPGQLLVQYRWEGPETVTNVKTKNRMFKY